jgi:hypothetical protein
MPKKSGGKGPPATGKPTKKVASKQMTKQAKSLKGGKK